MSSTTVEGATLINTIRHISGADWRSSERFTHDINSGVRGYEEWIIEPADLPVSGLVSSARLPAHSLPGR